MQLELYIIIAIVFIIGLIAGALLNSEKSIQIVKDPRDEKPRHILVDLGEEEHAPLHRPNEDIINHDGVGIVYRPTSEEIEKMNEPQRVKEAKEAIAETLKHAKEPEI